MAFPSDFSVCQVIVDNTCLTSWLGQSQLVRAFTSSPVGSTNRSCFMPVWGHMAQAESELWQGQHMFWLVRPEPRAPAFHPSRGAWADGRRAVVPPKLNCGAWIFLAGKQILGIWSKRKTTITKTSDHIFYRFLFLIYLFILFVDWFFLIEENLSFDISTWGIHIDMNIAKALRKHWVYKTFWTKEKSNRVLDSRSEYDQYNGSWGGGEHTWKANPCSASQKPWDPQECLAPA